MPRTHASSVLSSSKNPNWRTPRWLYNALHIEFGFALDAAADAESHLAQFWLGPGGELDDALCGVDWGFILRSLPRGAGHAIFVNPPYSVKLMNDRTQPDDVRRAMNIAKWAEVCAQTSLGGGYTVVGLFPYATQTRWWREYIEGTIMCATEIRKFPFRLKFDPPPDYDGKATGSNVNSAIVIWKPGIYFPKPWAPFLRYYDPRPLSVKRTIDEEDNGTDEPASLS